MDSREYRKAVSSLSVKRRNVITDTLDLIKDQNQQLYEKLLRTLEKSPIKKPAEHLGGNETDYFEVALLESEVQELVEELFTLEGSAVPTNDLLNEQEISIRSAEARRIADLVDEWNKINTNT